jgi:hypothetical protein
MKFLSDILAKAGLTVDGVVTLNNTATGQTPDANDNSTKLATTAWVRTFVQPYSLPIASASVLGGIRVGSGLSINSGTGVLSVTGASAASIKSTQTFVVTEGQTVFTVTGGYTPGLMDIFVNGVYLSPNQTTATNGTTFTINDPAATGDIVDIIVSSPIFEGAATTTDQLPEGVVNLYYTNARARAAITLTTTGVSGAATYNSSTGVFNIPNYQGLVPAGGVAGQVLSKVDGNDYNTQWLDEAPASSYTSQLKHRVKAGAAINKGQAVYVSSADGTNMIVSKASNASEATSSKTMGLLESTVSINGTANVITEGLLAGLDTTGANAAGDPVWLGTDGNLIYGLLNKPSAPAHLVFIGVVTRRNANNGEIFVKVQNGFELDELHDLSVKNASDGDMIKYVASTGLWTKIAATTTNITEGTNLYYTQARFDTAFAAKSTTNLTEGTNLYYTTARANSDFDTRLATKSTTNLAEGTNLYYTDARVGTYLTANSYATQSYVSTQINNLVSGAPGLLDTLDELAAALGDDPNFATTVSTALGNRLRVDINNQGLTSTQQGNGRINLGLGSLATLSSVGNAQITDVAWSKVTGTPTSISGYGITDSLVYTTSTYSNPSWITALAWSKITGAPAFITEYTETDTLSSVVSRGSSTSTGITINPNGTSITMGGGASAEGIRMQASTSTTYPVFLRSVNPSGGGETSAWIFKEAATEWGIWHNNPINTLDITRAPGTGIENNVGGGTNTVMIRLSHADGSGQFTGNILNRVGTSILDQSGNIPGTAGSETLATVTSRGTSTTASVKFGSHVDINPTNSAFRFYDGTTFRGGFGTELWGHSGSDANLVLYVNGDNTLFFSTSGTKRASLSSLAFNSLVALQQNGNQVLHLGTNTIPQNITLNTNADNWMWLWQASSSNSWYIGPSTSSFGIGGDRLAISSSGSSPNSELVLERGTTRLLEVLQANLQYKGNIVLHAGNYSSYTLPLSGGTLTGQLVVAYNSGTEPYVNAIFRAVGGANIGGVLVNGTVQSHIRFLVGSDTWGGTGAKQWQIRVGNGNTEDNLKIYSWTKGSDTMTILNNGDTTIHGNLSASNLSGTNTGDQTLNSLGALSSNSDSEQAVGVRNLYYNDGVKRVSSDPRWNESGYDADLGTLHIYSTTAAGVNYGRAGIALYNGSAYQYITTQSGQSNIYINNNVALHAGNYSSYSLPLSGGTLTGQMFISPSAGVNAWLRVNRSSTSQEAGVQMRTNGVDDWYVGTRSSDGVSSYHFYSYTTNTSVAQITSAGSLNIGNTTNTAYKLYVNGTSYVNNTLWANDNIVMRSGEFYFGGQTTDRFARVYHSGTAGSGVLNYQFFDGTNWNTRKTFDANGVATYTGNSTTLKINTTSRVLEVTGKDNYYPVHIFGGSGANSSYGLLVQAGTSTSDRSFVVVNRADNADYFSVNGGGQVVIGPGTASNARFAVSAPNSHFSYGNNVGATMNITPASTGQGGVNLDFSYWSGSGYPFVNFTLGGNNAFRITPSKEFWFWAEDNSVARANIYYSNATNEYRVYATNSSGGTIGVKLMEYNGSTYYQVLTTNTGLALTGGTLSGGLTANARIQNFVDIGPDDNVRTGLVAYDTRAMAAGVGGQLVLGYKYTSAGDYTEGAIIKMYKVNGTSSDYSSGIKFQARVSGNNLSTLMTLDHYGRLGIGISPTEKLDVRGNFLLKGDATDGGILTITRRYSTGQQTINFNNNHPSTNLDWTGARIVSADAGNYNGYLDFQVSLGNNGSEAAGTAAVATVMRLTKDARLGLGTLTPGYKFHLVGGSEVGSRFIVSGTYAPIQFSGDSGGTLGAVNAYSDHVAIGRGTSTGITADISIQASTGKVSIGWSTPLYIADKLLTIAGPWRANITSGGYDRCEIRDTNGSQIDLVSYVAGSEAYSNSIGMFVNGGKDALIMAGNANIRFVTGGYTEVARCTNSQEFLIGYTSDQGAYKLQVNGAIYASSDITAYSDISVKENIRTINNALERVTKSRGVIYDRIDTNSKDNIGFIAQELEVEFPELISTNADGTKGVKYQNMVAVLTEAVKEQQTQIESQKSEIEELKDLVKQLINR